jgi:hypothetical protein
VLNSTIQPVKITARMCTKFRRGVADTVFRDNLISNRRLRVEFVIAFQVSLNGKLICTAGLEDIGVLTSVLTWVRRRAYSQNHSSIEEELTFDVTALDGQDPKHTEHLKWLSESLHVGDSISIRIVDVEAADPPVERDRDDPEAVERAKRRYFEHMKREYDG